MRFFDLETRGYVDITQYGLDRHIDGLSDLTLVTWQDVTAEEKSEVHWWSPFLDSVPPAPVDDYWIAWNSRYDRLAWNRLRHKYGFPELPVDQVLDLAAQGMAFGLPKSLSGAAQVLRLGDKKSNKAMLDFADANKPIDESLWPEFIEYGIRDTELLYKIWYNTRKLSRQEWEQFWASEKINDRGIAVDLDLAAKAQNYAIDERQENEAQFRKPSDGIELSRSVAIAKYIYSKLPHDMRDVMVTEFDPETDEPKRLSLNSKTVLPELLDEARARDLEVVDMLEMLEYARGSAVKKFAKMQTLAKPSDHRVRGSYVFNGALTGRYSSWGLQLHNMPRKTASLEVLEAVRNEERPLAPYCNGTPVAKVLPQLLRPSLVAEEGNLLVWGDWSAIEARVLPWLANSRGSRKILAQFAAGIDIYVELAKEIFHTSEVSDEQRQAAKIAVLSLGYGGSVGAYRAMARGYGMRVDEEFAREIVTNWRQANKWARGFWDALWDAFTGSVETPGVPYKAGRLQFISRNQTVYCILPDGRPLVYVDVRREQDEETGQWEWTYRYPGTTKGKRKKIWVGTTAENACQGTAASLLREALVDLQDYGAVGHTHDEVILEVPKRKIRPAKRRLREVMLTERQWAKDLPLNCDIQSDKFYHK